MYTKWFQHPIHGPDFCSWMEKSGLTVADETPAPSPAPHDPSPKKRPSGMNLPDSPKKQKLDKADADQIVDVDSVRDGLLHDVKFISQNNENIKLQIRVGQKYLLNAGTSEVTIMPYRHVCSWGKGGFKSLKKMRQAQTTNWNIARQALMILWQLTIQSRS